MCIGSSKIERDPCDPSIGHSCAIRGQKSIMQRLTALAMCEILAENMITPFSRCFGLVQR